MKKNYETPIVEVMHFDAESVIMNGSEVTGTVEGPGTEYPD